MSASLSRRQFLTGCAGCATALATPAVADTPRTENSLRGLQGQISPEGQAAIAEVDQQFQQEHPKIDKTISAVENLGLDPSGGEPINDTFESALSGMSNTRITFPKDGVFSLSRKLSAEPNGPVELMGNGCSFKIPPNTQMKSLTLTLPTGSLVKDIVIDQTAKGSLQEFVVKTEGVARINNVTIKGYAPAKKGPPGCKTGDGGNVDAMFSPMALSSDGVVQARNFTATGGSAAGTHNECDTPSDSLENTLSSPMGIWVGKSNQGVIQLINPKIRGWSNGIYGGRTKGRVEIRGGTWVNNFNSQTRLGGGSIVDGASMLLDDREWSDKGPFKIGHQGVYAARVDPSDVGNRTDPIKFVNLKIVAKSMREGSSLIDFEAEAGPGIIRNCEITNHLDRSVVLGEAPSGGAGATNIMVENCLIKGQSKATVVEMQDRPQSRVTKTCIQLPGAGPDDIKGAEIGPGVSFGPKCKAGSGLKSPDKVGSGGNISSLPAPDYNGSRPGAGSGVRSGPSKKEVRKKNRSWAMKAISSIVAAGAAFAMFVCVALIAILKFLKG